jgi:hypothetical protein
MDKVSTFLLGVSRNAYFIEEGVFSRIRDNNFIFNEETINIWKDEKKNE